MDDAAQAPGQERSAYGGLALVMALVMTCGTIVAPALAVLASFIIDELRLTRSQLGWVIGVYSIVAALLSPRIGVLTDRVGGRRAAQGVFLLAAVSLGVMAGSTTGWLLAGSAIAAGIAQSAANPSTNKLIAARLPQGRRGLMMGIKQSGVQAGVFLTGIALPPLALRWGWQPAVAALIALPALGLVLIWRTVPYVPARSAAPSHVANAKVSEPIVWLAVYGFLMGLAGGSIGTYLPLFSEEAVGFSVTRAGQVAALGGACAFVSRIWFAHLAERTRHFGPPLGAIAGGAVLAGALLIAAQSANGWLLWPAAVLVGATMGSWNSVAMLAVISETGSGSAGRGSGVVLFGFLFGFGIGPPIFGASVDLSGSYVPGLSGSLILFAAAAVSMFVWARRDAAPRR